MAKNLFLRPLLPPPWDLRTEPRDLGLGTWDLEPNQLLLATCFLNLRTKALQALSYQCPQRDLQLVLSTTRPPRSTRHVSCRAEQCQAGFFHIKILGGTSAQLNPARRHLRGHSHFPKPLFIFTHSIVKLGDIGSTHHEQTSMLQFVIIYFRKGDEQFPGSSMKQDSTSRRSFNTNSS